MSRRYTLYYILREDRDKHPPSPERKRQLLQRCLQPHPQSLPLTKTTPNTTINNTDKKDR